MEKHIYDDNNGLHYTLADDGMYYPDLVLPEKETVWVGKYGLLRKRYLKEYRDTMYLCLCLSGKLNAHLLEVNQQAQAQVDMIVASMAKADGTDEKLKSKHQMEWVGRMNNYKTCAEELITKKLICK